MFELTLHFLLVSAIAAAHLSWVAAKRKNSPKD